MSRRFQFSLARLLGTMPLLSVAVLSAARIPHCKFAEGLAWTAVMFGATGGAIGLVVGRRALQGLIAGAVVGAVGVVLPIAAMLFG